VPRRLPSLGGLSGIKRSKNRAIASGVCHTDLHAAEGDWPVKPTLTFTRP
jgi:hypothetical protein